MKFYQVQKNESLCDIAKKFGVSKEQIINLNQLTSSDDLQAGDIIRIK